MLRATGRRIELDMHAAEALAERSDLDLRKTHRLVQDAFATAMASGKLIAVPTMPKLQPRDTIQMHIAARQWLNDELMVPTQRKRVVVTHHAPSARSVAQQYEDDPLTPAYASRMDSVVRL